MKEYVFLLLGVIIMSSVISMIAPETSLKRYVSILISFCIICAALRPIGDIVGILENGELDIQSEYEKPENYESVFNDTLVSGNEASFCALLKSKMSRELNIDEADFEVYADMYISDGEYKLESLSVLLCGKGIMQDPESLRAYTDSLFGIECGIIYG